ncbi:autotransporter outer membrane beta-barrel domain-containing protein [Alienimonas californiensis]|uniref:Autotransporter beta-domain protein n=1 Tax=Alienimonas californiensis TaxID=2527989 RepID=A0A517P760_9PLAN|nr:autotransporter outer membrane beta-barrel domain-containing protein [Alienimonas californiensis]QDT15216.1 Autotransporter beta-domain protein [Alienimonas californiensis]
MKTLFSVWRRRRGLVALRAAAFAAAAVGLTGNALADPEPPTPSTHAKSQPQKAVAESLEKHRPEWKHYTGTYPVGHPKDDGSGTVPYDFYDYDYYSTTKHERYRQLYWLSPALQQQALAQLSGEIYGQLPIARAAIEDQTYRNLGYLLRPNGLVGGVGAPVAIGAGSGPAPIGGIGFDGGSFGPAYGAPCGPTYGGPAGGPYDGGIYGGGFAPGVASDGLMINGPAFDGQMYGSQVYGGQMSGGPMYGGPVYNPTPDPAFASGMTAGTPVPAGSYLTPDGRLVGPDGQPVRPGAASAGPGLPIGPNGQPIRPNGPNFGAPGVGPGLNAPGAAGGLNGAGTPIPDGSTFGPNGEVIGPDGDVLGGGSAAASRRSGSLYGGPLGDPGLMQVGYESAALGGPGYGAPIYGAPAYGGPGYGGPGYGGPGLIGPGMVGGGCSNGLCGPPAGPVCGPAGCGPVCGPVGCGPVCGPSVCGWLTGHYVNGELDGTECRSGLDYDIGGLNAGLSHQICPTLLVGGFVGYSSLSAEANYYNLGEYDVDTFQFGGYFRKIVGNCYFIGAATAGYDEYDVSRNVDFKYYQRPATANFHGCTGSVFGELGYTKAIGCDCSHFIQPFASLQYTRIMRGGVDEKGSFQKDRYNDFFEPSDKGDTKAYKFANEGDEYGSNLTVSETRDHFLRTRVGVRGFRRLRNQCGTFRVLPEVRAYWAHEEFDPSSYTVRLNDSYDCPFVVAGLENVSDAGVLGTGLTFAHCGGCSVYGNVDGFFADRQTALALSGGTQFCW